MEEYINKYQSFTKSIIYDFNLGSGGLGDCIKYFIYLLNISIKNNTRLYYKKNNIEIENYIKLKYDIMYITNEEIDKKCNIVYPQMYYKIYNNEYIPNNNFLNINDVFYFSEDVIINSQKIFPHYINEYISIHLRLGDEFLELEVEKKPIYKKKDIRDFSEEKITNIIQENNNEYILFCCDNNDFRQKIKEKYINIIITSGDIGHTGYLDVSKKQILDTITEFYLLSNSKKIYGASQSGFSILAANFNNIPYIKLYNESYNYLQLGE